MDYDNINFIKRHLGSSIKISRAYINSVISVATIIEQTSKDLDEQIVDELMFSSCKLLSQNMNMSYFFCDDLLIETKSAIDVLQFLQAIIAECTELLEPLKREIRFTAACERSEVRIDEKAFTIAVINLLQNALLYSPKKSTILVNLENDGDNVTISLTNLIDMGRWTPPEERHGLGIPLCAKIADFYGGSLNYDEADGRVITEFSLLFAKDCSCLPLATDYIEYVGERFKPVMLYLHEVIRAEIPAADKKAQYKSPACVSGG
jgi:signal transduction histidine kinase